MRPAIPDVMELKGSTAQPEPMTQTATAVPQAAAGSPSDPPVVDIAIPVYNEERDLARNVRRLCRYLHERFPFIAVVTIVDNGSTDATWAIAQGLARELPEVRAIHLPFKGRGRALRRAWTSSEASIVAYMDVDLSTSLDALLPLVAPLGLGHSDVATGSRLARGAKVVRGLKREVISRGYNLLLHAVLGTRFQDAQCGFKALRAEVARRLLPLVEDEAWFFDTELLVLAQRQGFRIHEVPVDWTDDPDSRVDLLSTAIADLRGVFRLSSELRTFAAVGLLSTIAYTAAYAVLRLVMSAWPANAASLLVTCLLNTEANRRYTFKGNRNSRALRDHMSGLGALGLALGLTTLSLWGLARVDPHPARLSELAVLTAANLLATGLRFLILRTSITSSRSLAVRANSQVLERTA